MRDYRGGTGAAAEIMLLEPHHRHAGDRYMRSVKSLERRYDLLLSALSLSWLADDWSEELGGLDGAADGEDGEDWPDEAIDDDEPDGLPGLLLDGIDFDMLDPVGVVVCDVFWRSPHAAMSNAETTATDNAEAFITSPFVAIAN
jgi:hypothetical protein